MFGEGQVSHDGVFAYKEYCFVQSLINVRLVIKD